MPVPPPQPRGSAAADSQIEETETPRNVLPSTGDPEPIPALPLDAPRSDPQSGPIAGGYDDYAWRRTRPVILPQDLPLLTYREHFCCLPHPPLVLTTTCPADCTPPGIHYGIPYGCPAAVLGVPCADPDTLCTASASRWWRASAGGLVLAPDGGSQRRLSFSTAAPGGSLLSAGDAEWGAAGGVDIALTRMLASGRALEIKYWGLYPADQIASVTDPAPPGGALPDLNTTLNLSTLDFDNGTIVQSADSFFDGAERHQLIRTFEFHNLELNVHFPLDGHRVSTGTGWLGGIRYLDFDEAFAFWSDPLNTTWGDDPANELAYEIGLENRLVGVQLGVFFDYVWNPLVHVTGTAKAGVYNNDVKYHTRLGSLVTPAVVAGGAFAGQPFDLTARSDDVAFLGEAELGVSVELSWHWRLAIGYKSVVLSGIALAPDQIATNFNNLNQASAIDSSGSLLLYGGYARLERLW
jgi:hypothetical protein